MTYTFTVPGRLVGLNDYIAAERGNRFAAAKLKKDTEQAIRAAIHAQLPGVRIAQPVTMHYTWYEPNTRRDKDNIAFAKKFIQDALVKSGVLAGDGWRHIRAFTDEFDIDKENPHVFVQLRTEEIA